MLTKKSKNGSITPIIKFKNVGGVLVNLEDIIKNSSCP